MLFVDRTDYIPGFACTTMCNKVSRVDTGTGWNTKRDNDIIELNLKPECNRGQLLRPGWVSSARCSGKKIEQTKANTDCLSNCTW